MLLSLLAMFFQAQAATSGAIKRHEWLVAFVGYGAILFGITIIVAWHAHLAAIVELGPGFVAMKYNTAVGFIAAGLAFASRTWTRHRLLGSLSSILVVALGGLTLAEYAFNANLGIDQLVYRDNWLEPISAGGRMSGLSAVCFLLIGVALLLDKDELSLKRSLSIGFLASIVIGTCAIALLGYVFHLPESYRWGQLTRIAPHAACGMGALGSALFLAVWQKGRQEDERTPRWLPIPVIFGVLSATLVLYFALESRQDQAVAETLKASLETAENQINVRVEARIRSLVRIAGSWEFSGRPLQASWEHDASEYVRELPDIQAIEWIDASRRVQWIEPLAGNEAKLHLDLTQEPRRRAAIEFARDHKQPAMTRIVNLFAGGVGFVVYVPIYVAGEFDGWIAGVMKTQQLLDRYFPPGVLPGEAIRVSEGGVIFYERDTGTPPKSKALSAESKIQVHGISWTIQIWPTPQLVKRLDSPLPEVTLVSGILGSLLLAATVFLAQRSSAHYREAACALRDLKAAAAEIKTLAGLLPICASCKRVRDDTGYWNQIESYLSRHSDASFSHGYCPQCAVNACHEFGIEVPARIQAALEAKNFEV
jgi:sensor domain CHASE-containing protein